MLLYRLKPNKIRGLIVDVLLLKEVLDKNTYLVIKRTFRAGSGADL
jgi:hypothetical protein